MLGLFGGVLIIIIISPPNHGIVKSSAFLNNIRVKKKRIAEPGIEVCKMITALRKQFLPTYTM